MTDLAHLLAAKPEPGLGFRVGTISTFDPLTGNNTITVAGAVLTDVPILNSSESIALAPGDHVGLIRAGATYFIVGKVITPGQDTLAASAIATAWMQMDIDGRTFSTTQFVEYGSTNAASKVPVPAGYARAHFITGVSAGSTFNATGTVSVQPRIRRLPDAASADGPAINSGGSNPIAVANTTWAAEVFVLEDTTELQFTARVQATGTPTTGTSNVHVSTSVIFTR